MTIINAVGGDKKVKVSVTDKLSSFLINKLVAGVGIVITQLNIGGNETLEISAAGLVEIDGLHHVKCRIENGCVIYTEVFPMVDNTLCYMQRTVC